MKQISLWVAFIILCLACSNTNDDLVILGTIVQSQVDSVSIELLTFTSTTTIATTNIDENGNFKFINPSLPEPGLYSFKIGHDFWITILDTLKNENVEVKIDGLNKAYSSLEISTTRGNNFREVLRFVENIHQLQDSIYQSFEHYKYMHEETIDFSDSIDAMVNNLFISKIETLDDPISIIYCLKWLDSYINYHYLGEKIQSIKEAIPHSIYTPELIDKYQQLQNAYKQGNVENFEYNNKGKQEMYSFDSVVIGNQVWMAENLNIATPNSWCLYNDPKNCDVYGRLYNWYDALSACPVGWKLPTDDDWKELELYLGADIEELDVETWRGKNVGGKLKATSDLWDPPNKGATNSSGYNALPGGPRNKFGMYGEFGHNATFWTATEQGEYQAIFRYLGYSRDDIARSDHSKLEGHSVRCLKAN